MSAFDWPGLLRVGLCGLRLSPERFWSLSPAELLLMLGVDAASAPLTRQRLGELAREFPDKPERRTDDAE